MTTAERIREEALRLSPSERACLAHELILSIETPDSLTFSSETEQEIGRRIQAVRSGNAQGTPASEVFAEARRRIKGC